MLFSILIRAANPGEKNLKMFCTHYLYLLIVYPMFIFNVKLFMIRKEGERFARFTAMVASVRNRVEIFLNKHNHFMEAVRTIVQMVSLGFLVYLAFFK